MTGRSRQDRVFNPIPRRLVRRRITSAEVLAGVTVLLALGLAGAWILSRSDAYDPGERDLSAAALASSSVEDTLYRTPLRRWREPGSGGPEGQALDLGVFSATLLEGGWSVDGRVETYEPDNLYVKINGAAEQYLSFEFRHLHYVTLAREGRFVTLELYDQTAVANALGLFARQRDPDREVESRGDLHYYRTPAGAIGIRGAYFFKITGSESSPPVLEKAEQLLGVIEQLEAPGGGGEESGGAFELLASGLGVPFERISFQKENVFQYDFLEDFWFARPEKAGEMTVFLHRAPTAEQACDQLGRLIEEQSYEYKQVERSASRALLEHEYLGTVFTAGCDAGWLYGVEHAPDAAAARRWSRTLEEKIRGQASR